VQYLLGNGTTWSSKETANKLGNDKYPWDNQLQELAKKALIGGVSFGFFNLDHIDVFSVLEFAPLYDEENGALMAGIRFWQIAEDKPLRATLYEIDGYTDYIWKSSKGEILNDKRPYKLKTRYSEVEGLKIYDGENYPSFPIVPLWANDEHQSEIVGLREQIDCYDLIKSGFANTVDEASIVYWTIQNAGGMDDVDLVKFVERIKTMHAAAVGEDGQGATAQSHQQEAPYASREALLDRLDKDLYRDAMALNTEDVAGGAITATQIRAAYEPLNSKVDDFEYCVLDFIKGILAVAGITDSATFERSIMINSSEEITNLLQGAQYLPDDYVTKKLLAIMGDADQTDEILKQMSAEEIDRMSDITEDEENEDQ
jgi:SPP1 family phage portal protein